ncbi:MAG TPA: helix-turn-helix transcriptional regulator [Verrucomicrobiae bacterium]|jgi:transcriptional regulator with XRE-family HTH domain|nr:helix-turn-helix transcriptional regulator [Verrucomicrobiae bacterium]
MQTRASIPINFREARERAGLPPEEAARRMCVSRSMLRNLESEDDELTAVHSPADVQRFCSVLGVRPAELLEVKCSSKPLTPEEIAATIFEHCQKKGMNVSHFEDTVGWCVARSLEEPRRFLHDYSLDALHDICRELNLEWERLVAGL